MQAGPGGQGSPAGPAGRPEAGAPGAHPSSLTPGPPRGPLSGPGCWELSQSPALLYQGHTLYARGGQGAGGVGKAEGQGVGDPSWQEPCEKD